MRILVLVVYYLPNPISSAKLIHDLALELHHMGHKTVVVAPDENILSDSQVSCEEGIDVLRIRTGKIKTASRWTRAFNEIRLSHTIWQRGKHFFKKNTFDLIIYYSPTIFFGTLVKRLKKLFGCSSYLILRDIFPQWAVDAGILRHGGMVYTFFKWKERQNYEAANIIGVQSPANLHYFSEHSLDKKYNLEVLYNWAALTGYKSAHGMYRDRLGLKNKVVFIYGGNIGVAQDMDNIVRLAENLRNEPSAHFLLVGDGSEVARLRAKIAVLGLNNIDIHTSVSQEDYVAMLSEFDVGLISLDRGLKTQNLPGKMLSYMDQAKPILASINPGNDLKDILEENQAGMVCINGEDDLFADYARRLIKNTDLRCQIGSKGRILLERMFSVSKAGRQILSHFGKVDSV